MRRVASFLVPALITASLAAAPALGRPWPAPPLAGLDAYVARTLLDEGVYVKGFFFPVVPKGLSRIRVQLSAAHRPEHVDRAVAAFTRVGRALGVLPV